MSTKIARFYKICKTIRIETNSKSIYISCWLNVKRVSGMTKHHCTWLKDKFTFGSKTSNLVSENKSHLQTPIGYNSLFLCVVFGRNFQRPVTFN